MADRRGLTRQSTQLSKASSRDEGSWKNISFDYQVSDDTLHSPTTLENISFGSGSLIRGTTATQQISSTESMMIENSAASLDQLHDITKHEFNVIAPSRKSKLDEEQLNYLAENRSAFWFLDELKFISDEVLKKLRIQLNADQKDLFGLNQVWKSRLQSVKDQSFRSSRRFDASILDHGLSDEPDVRDYRRIQSNSDTLSLLEPLLKIRYPEPAGLSLNSSIHLFQQAHPITPYTPEHELFSHYLLVDQSAREKKAVLKWLEESAQHTEGEETFQKLFEELGKSAGIEAGTWNHGFLYTRERLKSRKRRKQAEQLRSSLHNSENTEPLVTHLDPDVSGREDRNLEKEDAFYDRSLWLMCFAMIRQGIPWATIREWCDEHNEGWRVGSFGMLVTKQESRVGLNGPEAGMLWRRMCLLQARQPDLDPYQKAVYGLLAGDYASVLPVCKSFEDVLYAKYNSLFIQGFEQWLAEEVSSNLPATLRSKFPDLELPNETATWNSDDITDSIFKLRVSAVSETDANDPFKLLQASIIANDLVTLIVQVGGIISERANAQGKSRLIPREAGNAFDKSYACIAENYDALRELIHIARICETLGLEFTKDQKRYLNHIVVAYIDYIRIQGKIDIIPTYAALLDDGTKHMALGKVIIDITDLNEQRRLLRLIESKDINLGTVIIEAIWHAASLLGFLKDSSVELKKSAKFASQFMEAAPDSRFWAGVRVRREFGLEEISFGQEKLVHAVEWFLAVPSLWQDTFGGVDQVMRWFLECAWFGPALAVAKRIPYKALVAQKIGQYLPDDMIKGINPQRQPGASFDLFNDEHVDYVQLDEEGKFTVDMLRGQARPLKELQELCLAVEQLVFWRDFEDCVIKKHESKGIDAVDGPMKKELASLLNELGDAIAPILRTDFLSNLQVSAEDQQDFQDIRIKYTSTILASYLSARYFAGHYLGASALMPAYKVAEHLASPAGKPISDILTAYNDMTNLVLEFAYISRLMLQLSAERDMDLRIAEIDERNGRNKDGRSSLDAFLEEGADSGGAPELAEVYSYRRPKRLAAPGEESDAKKSRRWQGEEEDIWDFTKVA